jgi:hypothetical protein
VIKQPVENGGKQDAALLHAKTRRRRLEAVAVDGQRLVGRLLQVPLVEARHQQVGRRGERGGQRRADAPGEADRVPLRSEIVNR